VIAEGHRLGWRTGGYDIQYSKISEPPAMTTSVMADHNVHDITHLHDGSSIWHSVKVGDCEIDIPACVYGGFCFSDLRPEAGLDLRMFGQFEQPPSNSVRGRLMPCKEDCTA
jgi:hypothetical protein